MTVDKKNVRVDISVIVPVYNREKYLAKCLESIRNQSYAGWECLVVDDGSTDGTYAICREFAGKDSRFKIYHQENKGVSVARNKGLEHAKGTYICFVDSDDFVETDYLLKLYEAIGDTDFCLGGLRMLSNNKTFSCPAKIIIPEIRYEDDFLEIGNNYMLNGPVCKLFKKEIIDLFAVRFPEGISYGEDTIFNFTYLHHVRSIRIIPDSLYNIVSTPGSLSDLDEMKNSIEIFRAIWNCKWEFYKSKRMTGKRLGKRMNYLYCFGSWASLAYVVSKHGILSMSGRYLFLKEAMAGIDKNKVWKTTDYSFIRRFIMQYLFLTFLFFEFKYLVKKII